MRVPTPHWPRGVLACATFLLLAFASAAAARAADTFTLAMTWHPAFCADRGETAECRITASDPPRFVLHGLWADWDINGDGRRNADDAYCIPSGNERQAIRMLDGDGDAKPAWLKLPAVELSSATARDLAGVMPGVANGLDRHEWWKHGTCSGLSAEEYFAVSTVLARQVERTALAKLVAKSAGDTVARKDLLAVFERQFGAKSARALMLDCRKEDGVAALAEIRIQLRRAEIAQGLNSGSLAKPAKPAKGDCPADIRIPD